MQKRINEQELGRLGLSISEKFSEAAKNLDELKAHYDPYRKGELLPFEELVEKLDAFLDHHEENPIPSIINPFLRSKLTVEYLRFSDASTTIDLINAVYESHIKDAKLRIYDQFVTVYSDFIRTFFDVNAKARLTGDQRHIEKVSQFTQTGMQILQDLCHALAQDMDDH